ncbi:hypothetical protein NDU88_004198 [Pleurodeles waltl]|uniref:Uncharacterized protein n=1 Tax=Pleurodeles waltl TaxID=8319 RepID=A0AAV7SI64_PLEWA|nr:hypothetical protein NDU88_004198 [Pleurodeles waltl]
MPRGSVVAIRPSPPGARSAIRQLHQSALFPRLLDPIFWVPQPRVLIQPPWVTGHLRPGPPRSGPRLGQTSHHASSSPVSQGSTRSRYPSFSPLLRCVPGPKGPPQVKQPRSLTPGHVATSKSFHTASLSLLASLRPQSFLGASSVAQSSTTSPPVRVRLPLGHQNPNGISTPARSLRRQPPLSSASGSPQPAALPVAAAPITGLPPVFFWGHPYPVSQSPCASTVRDLTWALTTSAPRAAAGAHTRSALSSGPRKASGPPQPTAPPKAATSIPFLPPLLFRGRALPVAQSLCASAVRDLTWAPWPPPAPPPLPESLLGASRCSVPSVHSPLRHHARPRPLSRAQARRLRSPRRADSAPPGSPQGPTHARPPPLVSPRSLDLIRPGEGTILTFYSPAPPELRVQACAISGSLATPNYCSF